MSVRWPRRLSALALFWSLCPVTDAQSVVEGGTNLTIGAGTTMTLLNGSVLATSPGAVVVNNGLLVLSPTALLDEASGAPIDGTGTERITLTYSSALNNAEPGGLGLVVTTALSPGTVVLERGHVPVVEPGGASSIGRWYDWSSTVNAGLDASIAFGYDPVQLNGINETDQVLHVRQASSLWQAIPSGVDQVDRQVNAVSLDSLGTFTTFSGALATTLPPVQATTAPVLYPTVSDNEVQVVLPGDLAPKAWSLTDGSGRLTALVPTMRTAGWYTFDASRLAPGTYHVLINGRSAGRFIRP